jgi:CHASE3 domain sensor protein
MRIPIFWRLSLGYLAILLLSAGLSAYSIIQLGGLSTKARAILQNDNQRIGTVEKLTDAFLSEVRYESRFVIAPAKELLDQYRQFNMDFARYMNDLQALPTVPDLKSRLARINHLHSRYHDLFQREVKYIQAAQPYGESRYRQEKEKILESTLRELDLLKTHSQRNLQTNLEEIEQAAGNSRSIAMTMTLLLIGIGFVLCYRISKTITAPLLEMQYNTDAGMESGADWSSDYSQVPEIHQLSETLHRAKDHLRAAHESNAAFVRQISDEFATPLISLKNRLNYLNRCLGEAATPEQRTILVILADETQRLIQNCARLQVPAQPAIVEPQSERESPAAGRGAKFTLQGLLAQVSSCATSFVIRLKQSVTDR